MSQHSRLVAANEHEAFRCASAAKETESDLISRDHMSAAAARGHRIEEELDRLSHEINAQAADRQVRTAAISTAAVHPYRRQDATWDHAPIPQYLSYY
ncbi:hypothetical protein DIPPA_34777 [Diplonema papillatum]|nr:hypothetical protein DIPPA_34777 [Diplonema papillatum]